MINKKVDFFFVGFPKSGSTTYYHLLKSHPEISSSEVKEINFFNTDFIRKEKKSLGNYYFQLAKSEVEYSRFFNNNSTRIRGDFTPVNIFSREAPLNIYKYNPSAKIIISVREPVSFLRSFHFQSLYNMIENESDFLKALSLEETRRTGQNIPKYCSNLFYLFYSSLIQYKKYIENYTELFGKKNVKIILFDDIIENEHKIFQEILHYLNVEDIHFVPSRIDRNPSHSLRFSGLRKIILSPPIKKWVYTKIPRQLLPFGAMISQKIFKKNQEKPPVHKEDIDQLKIRFRPNVVELNSFLNETELLNRNLLNVWKY